MKAIDWLLVRYGRAWAGCFIGGALVNHITASPLAAFGGIAIGMLIGLLASDSAKSN